MNFTDLNLFSIFSHCFNSVSIFLFFFVEITLTLLFGANAIYDFYLHSWLRIWMQPIEVTAEQKRLFRIADNEIGFKDSKSAASFRAKLLSRVKTSSPMAFASPKFSILSDKDVSATPPLNSSFFTSTPCNLSLDTSWHLLNPASADNSFNENSLRRRATATLSDSIKDETSLMSYLKEFDEVEEKMTQMNVVEQQALQNQSPFSFQKPMIDLTNVSYQPSDDSSLFINADQDENFSNVFMNTESADSVSLYISLLLDYVKSFFA